MKKIVRSLLLSISMIISSFSFLIPIYAGNENENSNNGMHVSKTAEYNSTDGSYTITLEAYATGKKITTGVPKPSDIVFVLDQSGSMNNCLEHGKADFEKVFDYQSEIDKEKEYYIYDGNKQMYVKVYYCSNCSKWFTSPIHSNSLHNSYNGYTPKTSKYDNSWWHTQFYTTSCTIRLEALQSAVNSFVNNVIENAKGQNGTFDADIENSDDVKHRIAIVGFASKSDYGNNTELLSISGSNSSIIGSTDTIGVKYADSLDKNNYKNVLQDISTEQGQTLVKNAINALDSQGATRTDLGLKMAYNIFENNKDDDRNKVVILFTDGAPTSYSGFEKDVANNAISIADSIKKDFKATIYSVGVFSGADASLPGTEPSEDLDNNNSAIPSASNWFMQKVSSNDGTVQTPSYFLSAGDTKTLNDIFKKLSDKIEGGSNTKLNSSSVIRDIISPQFELPSGTTLNEANIKIYSYVEDDGTNNGWEINNDYDKSDIKILNDKDIVSVTGFDFSKNWCGVEKDNNKETRRGNKLVISFKVVPKTNFLGGNNVYTNTSAGIFKDSTDGKPVVKFERPQVNVPIKDISVDAKDKNVYIYGTVTGEQLKQNSNIKCGEVVLDLSQKNYGLAPWQNEYVDIKVTIIDSTGNSITGFEDIIEDQSYNIEVVVDPKTKGDNAAGNAATTKTGKDSTSANIYVFKPEIEVEDSVVYYGDSAPTDYSSNIKSTKWKHGVTEANPSQMISTAPTLVLSNSPVGNGISDDKINTKNDIPVNVTVKIQKDSQNIDITDQSEFIHTCDCGYSDCKEPTDGNFWLHVKTCELTIYKAGDVANEPFVFTVYKDDQPYTEVSIVGAGSVTISELPVGTYTVSEDINWSWRYPNPPIAYDGTNINATLSSSCPTGTATVTNIKTLQYWLNGFSDVVRNVYGVSKP